jgi:class III poly(R)-hydroxyalkanoic acid synthase PhaE subunit
MMTLMKLMGSQESQQALSKGMATFAESMVDLSTESMDTVTEYQAQLVETFGKIGQHTTAYSVEDLDHATFEAFRELYRTELQKYLNIPKIGLPREKHERLSTLVDRSGIYYSHLFELLFLFLVPFEKTNRNMQEKMRTALEEGQVTDDVDNTYNDWIKTLEGHYMELLQSADYTKVLNETISSHAKFKETRQEVINSVLDEYQIPTNKDIDEVYKDLYLTRKKVKELSREVAKLQKELQALSARERTEIP